MYFYNLFFVQAWKYIIKLLLECEVVLMCGKQGNKVAIKEKMATEKILKMIVRIIQISSN